LRVFDLRNMPPQSQRVYGDTLLAEDEAAALSDWLLGGSPE
jgi:hypothetical protein